MLPPTAAVAALAASPSTTTDDIEELGPTVPPPPRRPPLRLHDLVAVVRTTRLRDVAAETMILSHYHHLEREIEAVEATIVAMHMACCAVLVMLHDQVTTFRIGSHSAEDILTATLGLFDVMIDDQSAY